MNNGAQCARSTDMSDFGCNNIQLTTTNFVSMLPSRPRQVQRYGTSIILSMMYYNSDECRFILIITFAWKLYRLQGWFTKIKFL